MSSYKPYSDYHDFGIDWLGMLPSHWEVLPTKRVFRLVAEPAPVNNTFELLSVYTDIGVKPRKELEQKGNKASTTDGYWLVKKRDIVVNKLLAWMGAVGYSEYDGAPCVRIVVASVFHKNITGSGKLDISEALS